MILQALVKHYENLAAQGKVSREGWCRAKVSYAVHLSKAGEITGIISLKQEETLGKKTVWRPQSLTVPEMVTRGYGISANFLCDNSKYFLGIDAEGAGQRVQACFQAAKEKHLELLKDVEGDMAQAVRLYFENWNPKEAEACSAVKDHWEELTDGGNLIFCMGMDYAQEDLQIRNMWEKQCSASGEGKTGICLVTGKRTEISRIHKGIKGVPGAQPSGAALVSFNAPAFESYGHEQSYNAPVGRYAEFAYTTALNYLLSERDYTFQLGDTTFVFWAESGEEAYQKAFTFAVDVQQDSERTLKEIFSHLKKQEKIYMEDVMLEPEQKFYILGLAPNAGRLSVRFFYVDSFGSILENQAKHYERLQMVRPAWEQRAYLPVKDILLETGNKNAKDKSAVSVMAVRVFQAILSDSRYPASLYTDTLLRIRSEQGNITWGRAGILKACLIKNFGWEKGETCMGLDENRTDTAYVLGRLFAVLEAIQKDSSPEINATIRERYFNSANLTPSTVFPILMRLKNSHLKKLEREKGSARDYYEKKLAEICEKLTEFPKRLTLEEQGAFDLGYYHQRQKKFEKKEDK